MNEQKQVMTPADFAEKMREYAEEYEPETGHTKADDLMCDLLRSLGYEEGIQIFDKATRWYA